MSARLYGRDIGNGSLAVVTRGFREVLDGAGLLEGFVALDRSGGSEEDDEPPGALARDGVFTGNLSHLPLMTRGTRHERHWVTVTPNSTHIPPKLLDAVVRLPRPRILSASDWGTQVIRNNLSEMGFQIVQVTEQQNNPHPLWWMRAGDTQVQIQTAHHGVSGFAPIPDELDKTREDFYLGRHRVVHFSTTEGERKGTLELIKAWPLFLETLNWRCSPELLLVLDHHARSALQDRMLDQGIPMPDRVRILPRGDMDAATMSRFLCQQHVVCCPSRGEGFGLIPISARTCGVPVVTTVTTGHSAGHCYGPGVEEIEQSDELLPIDDGPGALAPAVEPKQIVKALKAVLGDWPMRSLAVRKAAPQMAKNWSWQAQLAPLVEQLR